MSLYLTISSLHIQLISLDKKLITIYLYKNDMFKSISMFKKSGE
jgi:hypothetical protein